MRRRYVTSTQDKGLRLITSSNYAFCSMELFLHLLFLFFVVFLLCWLSQYDLYEKDNVGESARIIGKGTEVSTDITLLLLTVINPQRMLQQWLLPSSDISEAVCAWEKEENSSLPWVSVVVVQMATPGTKVNDLEASMLRLKTKFPERKLLFKTGPLDDADGGSWRAWRFTSGSATAHGCVREVTLVVMPTRRLDSPGGYDTLHEYVKSGLSALPYRTKYFLLIPDFLVPTVLAERRSNEKWFWRRGFLQRLLSATRYNEGRVAAVQCTILSKRPTLLDGNESHNHDDEVMRTKQAWSNFFRGLPPTPVILHNGLDRNSTNLAAYVTMDKGAFVGYGTNWNRTVSGQFFTRHLNGYNALDDRVWTIDESVDAVSPFCALYHRDVYDAVGGFSASLWKEQRLLQRRLSPSLIGTMGWSLLRETLLPDEPENTSVVAGAQMPQKDFSTLWPEVYQADDFLGWELSLRIRAAFPDWKMRSSAAMAVAWTTPMNLVARVWNVRPPFNAIRATQVQYILSYYAPSFLMTGVFLKQWGAFAGELFRSHLDVPLFHHEKDSVHDSNQRKLPLIELAIFSNYGMARCSGMMMEGMHYIVPLQRRLAVSFWGFRTPWCPGVPQGAMDALYRTQMGVNQWGYLSAWRQEQLNKGGDMGRPIVGETIRTSGYQMPDRESVLRISLLHGGPHHVPFLGIVKPSSEYNIARILSESSRVRAGDVDGINKYLDEVWVTSNFFKEVYRRSGVREELLHVVPESVDPYIINPNLYTPFNDLPELELKRSNGEMMRYWTNRGQSCESVTYRKKRRFRFLSIFKWEPRKGWDVLLSAYWRAFGPGTPLHDEVSLYIKTSFLTRFSGNVTMSNVEATLTDWAIHVARLPNFTSLQQFPHLVIIHNPLSRTEDICRLYRSSDAFVLPTRGEGWGMPAIEAMAMELPVLTTNWSGSTAFCTPRNAFLIPVDGLEEIPTGSVYGSFNGYKWAIPSIKWTAWLMEYVVTHPEHAKAVGRRAREDIVHQFSEEIVADAIKERLRQIAHKVSRRRSLLFSWSKIVLG